ncbi:MAG: WYL domain-containing protein, partial [Actinobacteria bacterium]|nr:WYL domain-containing protein [Actinomycetota bacterium]
TGFGTPNPDGSMTVEVPCLNRFAFHTWLLGFGEHAVVEGPAEIRDESIQWLNEIVAAANAGDR